MRNDVGGDLGRPRNEIDAHHAVWKVSSVVKVLSEIFEVSV